jgi:tetratricopeptide (TPR) repeat protein
MVVAEGQQMLTRIWQWLKGLFQRLFGGTTPKSDSLRDGFASRLSDRGREEQPAPKPLEDSDYEYLFRQLLEGVAHSWQQDRILRWFEQLKGRITYAQWVAWLRRFGERVLASSAPNDELARRLVLLGEMTFSIPSLQEIGEVAYDIGSQLLSREPSGVIWEYDGPDADRASAPPPLAPPYQGEEQNQQEAAEVETITLDELFMRLQQDPSLLQLISQQLGIETNDPQVIIQEVINQLNATNQTTIDEAVSWFNQGNQQNEAGDFEGAIASYDRALEIKPDLYEAWFNQGNAFSNLGQFEEALISYDKVIEINPDLHEAWHNRANALRNLGRLDEARASLDKAQEIKGN